MSLEKWTTVRAEHIHLLAQELAAQKLPGIDQLVPIADFEELYTFAEANPIPVAFSPQSPAWRLESVAARIVEAVAIVAHERLIDAGYRELARILLEHAEYLYTYPDGEPRPRLEAGSALAVAGCVCASLPHSELWRLAGFGRAAAALAEVAPAPTASHLTLPLDVAFSLADERKLPVLESAVTAYNAVLNRNFTPQNLYTLPRSDSDFLNGFNLDFSGMETVKAAVLINDVSAAKSKYTAFRQAFLAAESEDSVINLSDRSDTYITAKTYLECLLRLSIHPTPAIRATTEIGIAARLFPEFRHSEQLLMLALRRYQWIVDAFFNTDGFHRDRTLRAHVEAIADLTRFLAACGKPEARVLFLMEALERQVEACIQLSRPDLSFPPLGALPAPNFDAVELCTIVDSSFQRENFPYPDTTSHSLPETGYYVMRDAWESDAQYLFFDADPQESTNATDISQLALSAHGQELMTGAVRVLEGAPLADEVLEAQWIATPVFDWFERWTALVPTSGNLHASDIHHRRVVFYLKGEYFVLHDLVLGGATQTLEQVFRFGHGTPLRVSTDTGSAWTQGPNRSNLFIGAPGTGDLTVALDGDTVTYRQNSESPLVLNTLLFPTRPDVSVHPVLTDLPVQTEADVLATGFTLQLHDTTDTFLISDDGLAEMSAADITFVGESLFLRKDASGSAVQFVMLNGRFLQVGARVLVDLNEPCESYVGT